MRTSSLWALVLVFLMTPVLQAGAIAQEADTTFLPRIRAGTCDAPGDLVADLTELAPPTGSPVGDDATSAFSSYTDVAVPFDTVVGGGHAIAIERPADGQTVACGEIGGTLDAGGALTIGLRPASGSGYSGIAYLSATAGGTGVSTFLAETGAGGATTAGAASTDGASYSVTVRREVTLLVGSLQRVNALFAAPQPGDQTWTDQLMAELTLWHILHEEARGMTPPAPLGAFHAQYVDALSLLDSAALDITGGIENGDRTLLAQAGDKIDQAVAAIRALATPDVPASPAAGG